MGIARPSLPPFRTVLQRYGVALTFLALFLVSQLVVDALPPRQQTATLLWASTNVANLHHHPVPALIVSAFVSQGSLLAWLPLTALAMFGANRAMGNLRLAVVCAAGHVIGTLVSEGIVGYRIDHHDLPRSAAHIFDVGPSYVVVSAIVVAVLFGSWTAKVAALADFAMLVFAGGIFTGLTALDVPAIGHLTALMTAAILGVALRLTQGIPDRRGSETSVPT